MKFVRYAGAVVLTVVLLILARALTVTQPRDISFSAGALAIEHTTVKKIIEGEPDRIPVKIWNPENTPLSVTLNWIYTSEEITDTAAYRQIEMMAGTDSPDSYYAMMPKMEKGNFIFYYIDICDTAGVRLATVPAAGEEPIKLKYMDTVPPFIVLPHIFLMFITVYLATLGFFDSLRVIGSGTGLLSMAKKFRWATLTVFLGGFPFGWGMNYFAFGTVWEAVPFGWDFTDNKTQIVLLYLVFLILSMPGTLHKSRFRKNNYPDRALGWFGFTGYFLVLAIYLIPHSIQFSVPMTALFAYGLTGVILILYIIGLIGKKKWISRSSPEPL